MTETTPRAVCTVCTKSFLAHARSLAESIEAHSPGLKLFVLLADEVDGYFDPDSEPFALITLQDVGDESAVSRMCFYYTPFELCCALRGHLHRYMYETVKAEKWLFIDSDCLVFDSLDPVFDELENCSILLSKHSEKPVSLEFASPHELNFLNAGLYNGGFVGFRRCPGVVGFITWFEDRLRYYCFDDLSVGEARGLFVDQKWLNLVPLYFPGVAFSEEPGVNVGHWNLHCKTLEHTEDGRYLANERPLIFVHFSGLDMNDRAQVSKFSPMYDERTEPNWEALADVYYESLMRNGLSQVSAFPYRFSNFSDGTSITLAMRRRYYQAYMAGSAFGESPFLSADKLGIDVSKSALPSLRQRLLRKLRNFSKN